MKIGIVSTETKVNFEVPVREATQAKRQESVEPKLSTNESRPRWATKILTFIGGIAGAAVGMTPVGGAAGCLVVARECELAKYAFSSFLSLSGAAINLAGTVSMFVGQEMTAVVLLSLSGVLNGSSIGCALQRYYSR